jgi:hypothetical protein
MIEDQAADPAPMLTFLSAALTAVEASAAATADPTNVAAAEAYAAAGEEALVQQSNVFSELTKMIIKVDETETNTCGGYDNIFQPYLGKYGRQVKAGATECAELVSVACITQTGLLEFDTLISSTTVDQSLSWVAGCKAARKNMKTDAALPSPVGLTLPATCFLELGIVVDDVFLKQLGPLMYIVTPDYIATMLYYFQKLSALTLSFTLTPGDVPGPNAPDIASDGIMISRTMQEWSHGFMEGGLAQLVGGHSGYIAADHETGSPSKEPRQYLTGCDNDQHVNVRDQRGDACAAGQTAEDCFNGLYTHYDAFAAQGYEPCDATNNKTFVDGIACEVGLGMRITGYDGASSPSVTMKAWREKLDGKVEHLRAEKLPVYVSQAYQDLNLVRNDSSFMVLDLIEATKYVLDPSTLSSSIEATTKFIGLLFDGAGQATPTDGVMDRKMLDGLFPHVALSQPYFLNGATSLVENIEIHKGAEADATRNRRSNSDSGSSSGSGSNTEEEAEPLTPDASYSPLTAMTSTTNPEYDTWIAVEQLSGVTIAAHKRLQANFIIDAGVFSKACPKCVTNKPFPVYWIDETGALTTDQADQLSSFLGLAYMLPLLFAVLFAVGLVLLLVAGVMWAMAKKNLQG